jgi:DNA-binding NarL/FixJ family response regulator
MSTRVVIVDDHGLLRDGLEAMLLAAHRDFEVVAKAGKAGEARATIARLQPALTVIDASLPDDEGVTLARELVAGGLCSVLLLAATEREDLARSALDAGVQGLALKAQAGAEVVDGIQAVARGERYVAPSLRYLLDGASPRPRGPLTMLTPREREIFDLAVKGLSNEAMAKELTISRKTVETHRARINSKLDVHSSADLVRFAASHGLLQAS